MTGTRSMGLFGATLLGVGAIVGGGILALAGVAFAATGPGAILAFALNGGIAALTAASFAELARRFPETGGTYTYAKKVLSIEVAFVVGWVVWFASILAGVLYALGFAAFLAEGLGRGLAALGRAPGWVARDGLRLAAGVGAVALYALVLVRRAAGGGRGATIGKVVVFVILIGGGAWAWLRGSPGATPARLDPFLPEGPGGLIRAMGYTFIALQGFDLIAAVAGEVREPDRTLPRAMFLSLGIALVIYLPLLFLIATVGAPAEGIRTVAAGNPEGLVAAAAEAFMGTAGYWLVIGAGLLSMLSALHANLLAASRVSFAMARDRTLPRVIGTVRRGAGTPGVAVAATAGIVAVILLLIGDVSAAGAASSLIFLISFAMVHWAAILARRRSGDARPAIVPLLGAFLCLGLATFQAFAVREAGGVVALWLGLGIAFYLTLLAPGARLADASAEARDPDLARLRGRRPLVLVPIANPRRAATLVDVAATLRTPTVGRILLLSVVRPPRDDPEDRDRVMSDARDVLGESLYRSLQGPLVAETLFTVSDDPWSEIARVAREYECETVLLGMPDLEDADIPGRLAGLLSLLDTDVVVMRAPARWHIGDASNVLVLTGGRRHHGHLRARLLASLSRSGDRSLTFLRTLPPTASDDAVRRAERELRRLAGDEAAGPYDIVVERAAEPREAIIARAAAADLVVMGMHLDRRRRALGGFALAFARDTDVPLVIIGRRPGRTLDRPLLHATGL